MIFVLFVQMRKKNLLSIFSGLFWSCRETNVFWKNFQDCLIKNLIRLKPNSSLSSAAVLGLKANFFSNTKQYFYFLVARYYIWTCRTRETNPKIEGFSKLSIYRQPFLSIYLSIYLSTYLSIYLSIYLSKPP